MDEIQKAKKKLAQTQTAADIEQKKIEDLSVVDENLSKNIAEKEEKVKWLDVVLAEKESNISLSNNILAEVVGKINEKNNSLSKIDIDIDEKTKNLTDLNNSISTVQDKYRIEVVKLESSFNQRKEELDNEIKKLEKENEALLSANKTIADGNIKLKLEGDELENIIIIKNKDKDRLEKEVENLEMISTDLNLKNNKIKEENSNLESANNILKEDIEKNKKEKDKVTVELEKEKKELDNMKAYRIKLVQKGKDINIALDEIAKIYKEANIQLPIEIEKINI